MQYEISVRSGFSAAHRLLGSKGPCENLHGHNWTVEAIAGSDRLDQSGMVMDFTALRSALTDVISRFDHTLMNELPDFARCSPSSENLARIILERLSETIDNDDVIMLRVKVWETEDCCATAIREEAEKQRGKEAKN